MATTKDAIQPMQTSSSKKEDHQKTLQWLRNTFPKAFTIPPRPLKKGIIKDILALKLDNAPSEKELGIAIGHYTRSYYYLYQVTHSLIRFDLRGSASRLTPQDKAYALQKLQQLQGSNSKNKSVQKRTHYKIPFRRKIIAYGQSLLN